MSHLYLRISKFAFKHPEGFTPLQVKSKVALNELETKMLDEYFTTAYYVGLNPVTQSSETIFSAIVKQGQFTENYINKSTFILKPEVFFSYIDYLEFQESIKSSGQSMEASRKAITIAWITLMVSIIFSIASIYFSQSTEIDKNQFDEIKNFISGEIEK